jgi:RNA polymerase sigma-70 factor (ECF subfamily)
MAKTRPPVHPKAGPQAGSAEERLLVRRILAGDEQAFNQLYESHKKRLERTAIHFLGAGHPQIEDVLQNTFLHSLPKLREFRFESSLFTWLNHFTVNFCYQALKKGNKTTLPGTEVLQDLAEDRKARAPEAWQKAVHEEIEALSPEHRQMIQKRDIEGASYRDMARELKLAPGTVMSRLARARAELRKRLKKKRALFHIFWE